MPRFSQDAGSGEGAPLRVVMLDLLSIIPYYTGHLCEALNRNGSCRVDLASITYDHDPEFFKRIGVRNDPGALNFGYELTGFPVRIRQALKALEYLLNLLALLVRMTLSRPDVLHIQFLPLLAYGIPVERWFLLVVRALGIRTVYTVHNVLPQNTGDRFRLTYSRVYELADMLICHDSEAAVRLQTEFAVSTRKVRIIPHGPLFEESPALQRKTVRINLGVKEDDCVVLWQGILRPYKGVSFLLNAWRLVCAATPKATLLVVGSGEKRLERELRKEVSALGIQSRVRQELRFVSMSELDDYYAAADVLVYPYSQVTTSGALMTGIVRRKAIVATRLPAFEHVLRHEESALLVRYGDEDGFASSLLRLIHDPSLRHSLAERLHKLQSKLPRWDEIAKLTVECYGSLHSEARCREGGPVLT
jgi:glycosyltransferase involved in cell wall biosynthesis